MNPDQEFAIATAPKRDSLHWDLSTVTWGEICTWIKEPADKKEAGNYFLGTLAITTVTHKSGGDPCTEVHRRKNAVISRSAITLDVDYPDPDFLATFELTFPYAALIHTTYSSAPDAKRYRLIVPTDREMAPDEYIAASGAVVQLLGLEQFDKSTTQAERYMFRPATQEPNWFEAEVLDGPPAPVAALLKSFDTDLSQKPIPKANRTKRDPFEIEGVVGSFNRAYEDWDLLIANYDLPYEKVDDDRYHLAGAASQAGMGPVPGVSGLVYSHHSNDPAYGKACSAFDLVRLHWFGDLDEEVKPNTPVNKLPSHEAMLAKAQVDARVVADMVGVDFATEMEDEVAAPNAWKLQMGPYLNRKGEPNDVIQVRDLIRDNDPYFSLLYFNEMSLGPELSGDVPWRKVTQSTRLVTNADRYEFTDHIEREYRIALARQKVDAMIDTRAIRTPRHPIREYLDDLVWDKQPRVEECLPGVAPTDHTRRIARKMMVGAVARVLDPGCKWDYTLVLKGDEGLGKSRWIDLISRGYSASLGRIDNKDTLLAMQRSWIMVADEGHSLRKGDADQMKEFLTRTEDMFRMPYDRETVVHKRHCVIWSTTNDETFLTRQVGNRRFIVVHCENAVDFSQMNDHYIDQLWAEAVHHYRAGEPLFFDKEESEEIADAREQYVEEDSVRPIVEEYLSTLVPTDWWDMSPEKRQQWLTDRAQGFVSGGDISVDRVCSAQIWVEAMGNRLGDWRRGELLHITNVLKTLPGWKRVPDKVRIKGYGPQVIYIREELL